MCGPTVSMFQLLAPHPQCEVGLWSHVGPTFVTAAEYPSVITSHSCLPRALTDLGCVWGVTSDCDHVLALGPPLQSFRYCYIWDWVCWFTGHAHFYNAKLLSKVTVTTFTSTRDKVVRPPVCTRISNELLGMKFQFFHMCAEGRIISNSRPPCHSS